MKILFKLWYWVIGEPHAGKAIKSIEKAIGKLSTAVDFQKLKAEAMAEAAKLAAEASKVANEEADRAARIFKKLEDLIK